MEKKVLMAVITHKEYRMPDNPIYVPVEVASFSHEKQIYSCRDNVGDNISKKNPYFCELTGFYSVYKNEDFDYIGFVHYRRLFLKKGLFVKKNYKNLISGNEIICDLNKVDFILPKKRHYFIENNYVHYKNAHKIEALDKTGEIIKEIYPDYYPFFIKQMKRRTCHLFNMFISNATNAKKYLDWLFSILFELERRIKIEEYKGYDKRVYGFVAERLIDVYIEKNGLSYSERKYFFTEKQNWPKKIIKFLKRHIGKNNDTTKQ